MHTDTVYLIEIELVFTNPLKVGIQHAVVCAPEARLSKRRVSEHAR